MKIIRNIFGSSLGKKYIMAVTGFVLFLFVVGHLVGNLQIFLGPEILNRYGYLLQSNVELLWPVRIILLTLAILHIWSAARLEIENRAARGPVAYSEYHSLGSTFASRTMLVSGLIVFCFIVYHLLHYTVQVDALNFTGRSFHQLVDEQHRHNVYAMMVLGFSNPFVSLFYILGVGLLCLHLSHGASAMFQSLGLKNEGYRGFLDKGARIVALLIFIGYALIPIAVLCGYGKEALK